MDNFKKSLDECIIAFTHLSEEWEKLERDYSDQLSEKYPFNKDFSELIIDMMEWRKSINK
ncbi:UNVERIFIED_ORG: type VI protein secretion system component VasK [Bacillus proteolyticus]